MRPKDPNLWIMVGATLVGLALAWQVKAPCFDVPWDGQQYRDMCYTDIPWIYGNRHQDVDALPYHDMRYDPDEGPDRLIDRYGFLEYPVLTGLFIHATARLSSSVNEFYLWNAALLSLFALGTTLLLYRIVDDRRRTLLWALGPPMLLYGFHNWDLLAVFFTVLSLYHYRRDNAFACGVSLGLGACAKVFPIFLAPILGLALLRRESRLGPQTLLFGCGILGVSAVLNLPFYLANRSLFLETFRFHAERTANFETPWYIIGHYGREWKTAWMAHTGTPDVYDTWIPILFLGGLACLGALAWLRRLEPVAACFAVLLLFLVVNKVYSIQYALWLLPFFVMLKVPWRHLVAFGIADVAVYVTVFRFFDHMWDTPNNHYFDPLAMAVLARVSVLVWMLTWTVRGAWTRADVEAPAPAPAVGGAAGDSEV